MKQKIIVQKTFQKGALSIDAKVSWERGADTVDFDFILKSGLSPLPARVLVLHCENYTSTRVTGSDGRVLFPGALIQREPYSLVMHSSERSWSGYSLRFWIKPSATGKWSPLCPGGEKNCL